MLVQDLGTMAYRDAWAEQERGHELVVRGGEERVLLVEHPPVITFGRRAGMERNVRASEDALKARGVEVVQSDRGGDVTFHGPGQLVAYPIVRLIDHKLSVGGYVHGLEEVVVGTLADLGVRGAHRDPAAVGVWVHRAGYATHVPSDVTRVPADATRVPGDVTRVPGDVTRVPRDMTSSPSDPTRQPVKVCAIGVRVRRGVTMHGLALNVSTDLSYFDLIIPCGLVARQVTSLVELLGQDVPTMDAVKRTLASRLCRTYAKA